MLFGPDEDIICGTKCCDKFNGNIEMWEYVSKNRLFYVDLQTLFILTVSKRSDSMIRYLLCASISRSGRIESSRTVSLVKKIVEKRDV